MHKAATFSPCGKYRYTLERIWDDTRPLVLFVMLNPSKANAHEDDRTIIRCCDFVRKKGFGGILVANLYALIETDSTLFMARLREHAANPNADNPIGEDGGKRNDIALTEFHSRAGKTVVAWGANGTNPLVRSRKREVLTLIDGPLHALDKPTAKGEPRHPSRLPKTPRWREYR